MGTRATRAVAVLGLLAGTCFAWQDQDAPAKKPQPTTRPAPDADNDPPPDGAVARLGSIRYRHEDHITRALVAPDGKTMATVSPGRPAGIEIWDLTNGKRRRHYNDRIYQDIALSSDGKTLVLGTWEAGATFVDLRSGEKTGHVATLNATQMIALSPDSKTLAALSFDQEEDAPMPSAGKLIVCLYDVAGGKLRKRIERKHDLAVLGDTRRGMRSDPAPEVEFWNIRFLAFTGDGKSVAAAGWDKTVTLWEVQSGEFVREFGGLKQPAYWFALSSDGKTLAAACADKTLRGYDLARNKEVFKLSLGMQSVRSLAFSPDGKHLAVGGAVYEGNKWIPGDAVWDVAAGKRVCQLPSWGSGMTYTPDGKTLVVCDGTIRLFDPAMGKSLRGATGHNATVLGLAFSPDGQTLVSEGGDRTVRWWSLKTGKQVRECEGYASTGQSSLAFSPDGRRLAHRTDDRTVCVRDAADAKEIRTLNGHAGFIYPVAFSADGKTIVSAERDGPAIVWNAEDGKEVRRVTHRFGGGESLALSADGSLLAVAKCYNTAPFKGPHEYDVLDTTTGKPLGQYQLVGTEAPSVFAFSRDKKVLAAGTYNGLVSVVDVKTGQEIVRITGHDHWVQAMAVSPDGSLVATSGGFKKSIRLWDARTGKQIREYPANGNSVPVLAFSPDGNLLAAGGSDTTIVLWDVRKDRQ